MHCSHCIVQHCLIITQIVSFESFEFWHFHQFSNARSPNSISPNTLLSFKAHLTTKAYLTHQALIFQSSFHLTHPTTTKLGEWPFRIHLQPCHPSWKGAHNCLLYVPTLTHTTNTIYLETDESRIVRNKNWSDAKSSVLLSSSVASHFILINCFYVRTRKHITYHSLECMTCVVMHQSLFAVSKLILWSK